MFVKDLQQYLSKFTDGTKGNAVSNASIFLDTGDNVLKEIARIEVQENQLIGQYGLRVVLKPEKYKVPNWKKLKLT
tara:strand:- start:1622 stop:1849 length:228 start_codon:yes stop_codon:yes gene_type:complete